MTNLRKMGTSGGGLSPRIKRATGSLATGRSVYFVPDANRADANGTSISGTSQAFVYLADDATREAFTTAITYTPPVSLASSTKRFVGSFAVGIDDRLAIAYQGSDNSLRFATYTSTGTNTWGTVSDQTVVAANAVTDRFRAIDVSYSHVGSTGANPAIIVYESSASTGQGAYVRVYVRLADGTTWIKAWEQQIFTTQFIKAHGEDVSISWGADGIVSNVGRMAIYYTQTHTTGDNGAGVKELSFNISTGTTNSATVVGTWFASLFKNQAAGTQKAMLFKYTSTDPTWILGGSVGANIIQFYGMKLHHNVFTGVIQNRTPLPAASPVATTGREFNYKPRWANNLYSQLSASFADRILYLQLTAYGINVPGQARTVVIRWPSTESDTAEAIDTSSRIMDNGYTLADGYIGVFGGNNARTVSGDYKFDTVTIVGSYTDSVSASASVLTRYARAVHESAPAAPTLFAPITVTQSNNRPVLVARVQNLETYSDFLGIVQWQLATDSGFTTNVRTVQQPNSHMVSYSSLNGTNIPSRVIMITVPEADDLFSGTWYARVRLITDIGGPGVSNSSAWSTTQTFDVSHPPTALQAAPSIGKTVEYGAGTVAFSWTFTDTESTDSQSAYQVIIERNDTGATVSDTGKVVSAAASVGIAISSGLKDIPLQWKVRLWDIDDVAGAYSGPTLFTVADAAVVTVTAPVGTIATALPTIQWSAVFGGTRVQRAFRVEVINTDAAPDVVVADSGWIVSTDTDYTFPAKILNNGINYSVTVEIQDDAGLVGEDSQTFDTDWIEPDLGDLVLTIDAFKVIASWTDANIDPDFMTWRLYRRYNKSASAELDVEATATTWVLIMETDEVLTSYTYNDYLAPLNKVVEYALVQMVDRFGSLIESDITDTESTTLVGDRYFFIPEVPVGSVAAFQASYVTADSFTREVEQQTIHVAGRGRQVQVGDDLGYTGTLTFKLRNLETSREDREFIERLASSDTGNMYLKSPFGDVLYVALGNPSFSRMEGVGLSDMGDLQVSYTEVFNVSEVTRS